GAGAAGRTGPASAPGGTVRTVLCRDARASAGGRAATGCAHRCGRSDLRPVWDRRRAARVDRATRRDQDTRPPDVVRIPAAARGQSCPDTGFASARRGPPPRGNLRRALRSRGRRLSRVPRAGADAGTGVGAARAPRADPVPRPDGPGRDGGAFHPRPDRAAGSLAARAAAVAAGPGRRRGVELGARAAAGPRAAAPLCLGKLGPDDRAQCRWAPRHAYGPISPGAVGRTAGGSVGPGSRLAPSPGPRAPAGPARLSGAPEPLLVATSLAG